MKRHLLIAAAVLAATACAEQPSEPLDPPQSMLQPACEDPAPVLGQPDSRLVDRFIVVFRDGTDPGVAADRLATEFAFTPIYVWGHALLGMAAELPPAAVAGIRCAPEVEYLEHDQVMWLD